MEELIFFAVIIFFSILESIARSRKSKGGGEVEDGPLPDPREWEARLPDLDAGRGRSDGDRPANDDRPAYGDLPAYDDDPSYDDAIAVEEGASYADIATERRRQREDRTLQRYKAPRRGDAETAPSPVGPSGPPHPPGQARPSSETMLPGDLLEQLEALARGRQAGRGGSEAGGQDDARTIDLPRQSPPVPVERTEVGTGRGASTDPVGTHAPVGDRHVVHGSHVGYGTDPSSRARSEQDGLDPLAEYLDSDGVGVRRQLFGGRAALRQAFVLKEVLGPPKALRDDEPVW